MKSKLVALTAAVAAAGLVSFGIAEANPTSTTFTCTQTDDGTNAVTTCPSGQSTTTQTVAGPTTTATATVTQTVPGPTSTVTVSAGPYYDPDYPTTLFYDDFSGSAVDATNWNVRNNSYASNELSIDTNRASNVFVSGGALTLRAQRETYTAGSTTRSYTSGYLDTTNKWSGNPPLRVDARMKLPLSKGMWPALWMRGNSTLGEIDILEAVGGWAKAALSVHQSTNGDMAKLGYEWTPPAGFSFGDFHTYSFEWDANGTMRWIVDDNTVLTRTTASIDNKGAAATWLTGSTFASPFNIRLNLQVGGSMPNYYGLPVDATSVMPADFTVDYLTVRGQ